jgi:hypothetical protein
MSSHGTMMLVMRKRMLPIFLNDSSVKQSKSAVNPDRGRRRQGVSVL